MPRGESFRVTMDEIDFPEIIDVYNHVLLQMARDMKQINKKFTQLNQLFHQAFHSNSGIGRIDCLYCNQMHPMCSECEKLSASIALKALSTLG